MSETLFKQALKYIEIYPDDGDELYKVWFSHPLELDAFIDGLYNFGKTAKPQEVLDSVIGGLYIGWVMHQIFADKARIDPSKRVN